MSNKNNKDKMISEMNDEELAKILIDTIFAHSDFNAPTVSGDFVNLNKQILSLKKENGDLPVAHTASVIDSREKLLLVLKNYGKKDRPLWLINYVDALALGEIKLKGKRQKAHWARNIDVVGVYDELTESIGLNCKTKILNMIGEKLLPNHSEQSNTNLTTAGDTVRQYIKSEKARMAKKESN